MRYDNPRQTKDVAWLFIIATILLIIGLTFYLDGGGLLSLVVAILLPSVFYLANLDRNYLRFPKLIDINDDGIIFQFPLSRKNEVRWSQVKSVYSDPGNSSTFMGRWARGGSVFLHWKMCPYPLSYEISEAVRAKYREAMGRYPPEYQGR